MAHLTNYLGGISAGYLGAGRVGSGASSSVKIHDCYSAGFGESMTKRPYNPGIMPGSGRDQLHIGMALSAIHYTDPYGIVCRGRLRGELGTV